MVLEGLSHVSVYEGGYSSVDMGLSSNLSGVSYF